MLMPESGGHERDVKSDEAAREEAGEAHQAGAVGGEQHYQHQAEGDQHLGQEGDGRACGTGKRGDVGHGRVGEGCPQCEQDQQHAGKTAQELGHRVEHGIPAGHLAQAEEGQRDGRVQMGTRLAAPGRIDDAHGGDAHQDADERPLEERVERGKRRGRVDHQYRAQARRDHEGAETPRLHHVLGPVPGQCCHRSRRIHAA
jgi:hypothetical protein